MERLFVDTNCFLYLLTKQEGKWDKIADIFDKNMYLLYTNVFVLNELKYKLLWTAATEVLKTTNKFDIIKYIKANTQLRKSVYSKFLEFYLNIRSRFIVLPVKSNEEILSCSLSNNYGLLPTDASIAASMISNNIKKILTNDADFKKIDSFTVVEV